MNPVKFCQDQIQNSFLLGQIDKIFENFVRPDEYLSTTMNNYFPGREYFILQAQKVLSLLLRPQIKLVPKNDMDMLSNCSSCLGSKIVVEFLLL